MNYQRPSPLIRIMTSLLSVGLPSVFLLVVTSPAHASDRGQIVRAFETQRRGLEEQVRHERQAILEHARLARRQVEEARSHVVRNYRGRDRVAELSELNHRQRQIDLRQSAELQQLESWARSERETWRHARDHALQHKAYSGSYRPQRVTRSVTPPLYGLSCPPTDSRSHGRRLYGSPSSLYRSQRDRKW